MTRTLYSLLAAALLAAAGPALAQGNPQAGENKVAVCTACHAADGNSAAATFPKVAGLGEKYIYKQLLEIKTGVRVVPQMAGLLDNNTEQDLWDMAAFYASKELQLSGAKPIEVQLNSGEKVDGLALGERIYRAGNLATGVPACTGCHSPRGLGNDPAGYPRLSGQWADYTEKQLRDWRAGNRANDGEAAVMRGVAANMSDAEITAVSQYISGLH